MRSECDYKSRSIPFQNTHLHRPRSRSKMHSTLLISSFISFAILLLAAQANATEKGSFSGESKTKRDTCGGLVKSHDSSESSGSASSESGVGVTDSDLATTSDNVITTESSSKCGCSCPLSEALYNISLTLDISIQIELELLIEKIEASIKLSGSLDSDDIVVETSAILKNFSVCFPDIWSQIKFQKIGSWGYFIDFVYVSKQIQIEKTSSVVTLDSSGGCTLISALLNATEGSQYSSKIASFVAQIKIILGTFTWSSEQQLSAIYSLYLSESADFQAFLLSINISGFGSFSSFVDVCQTVGIF